MNRLASWPLPTARKTPGITKRLAVLGAALILVLANGYAASEVPVFSIVLLLALCVGVMFVGLDFSIPSLLILICASVDIFIHVDLGPISLMGFLTAVSVVMCWLLWLIYPRSEHTVLSSTWPCLFFIFWCLGSASLWDRPTVTGLQQLLVSLLFVGMILFSGEAARIAPRIRDITGRAICWSTWISVLLYHARPVLVTIDPRLGIEPRSFALFSLLGIGWYLAQGRYGSLRARFLAIALIMLVMLSLSRAATASALVIFVLATLNPRTIKGWAAFVAAGAVSGLSAYLAIMRIESLRSRFTEGDVSLTVGGVAINAEGRTRMWEITLGSFQDSPWWGKGIGTASQLIELTMPGRGHPHNDYLRILHDLGIVGMMFWLLGQIVLMRLIVVAWNRADRGGSPNASFHLATLLSMVALYLTMFTDNVIVYTFVMLPLGVLIGTSISLSSEGTTEASPTMDLREPWQPAFHDRTAP